MNFNQDATNYAEKIRRGELSIVDLVDQSLALIKEDPAGVNAVSHIQEDYARQLALDYQARLDQGDSEDLPAFFGVPILLKDLGQAQAGMPTDSGARILAGSVADYDSNFTKAIKEAGFIILGRTNVPEFGFKNISDSQLHGPVRNPADLAYQAGGSSGGAAAAVKSGYVPIATASDGGGSIRIPASFTGLIGLKPSRGKTPVGPGSYRGWQGASIDFVITRSIRDTFNLLKEVETFQTGAPFPMPTMAEDSLKSLDRPLRIGVILETGVGVDCHPEAQAAVMQARTFLEDQGHQVQDWQLGFDKLAVLKSYFTVNAVETEVMMSDIQVNYPREIGLDDLDPLSWGIWQAGKNVRAADYSKLLTGWDQLSDQVDAWFDDFDLILSPATNGPAPKIGTTTDNRDYMRDKLAHINDLASASDQVDLILDAFSIGSQHSPYAFVQNIVGIPAISLPVYETDSGLPVGIQLSARKGNDYLLLQVGQIFEKAGLLKI